MMVKKNAFIKIKKCIFQRDSFELLKTYKNKLYIVIDEMFSIRHSIPAYYIFINAQ